MQYRYDLSVQEQIDRKMCKPGYTWNDTLGKCLGGYGGGGEPEEPQETPDGAVKQEKVKRAKEKAPPAPKQ